MPKITLYHADGSLVAQAEHLDEAILYYRPDYQPGDYAEFEFQAGEKHCVLSVDPALPSARVYLPTGRMRYTFPFGEGLRAYPPAAFAGQKHLLTARPASQDELRAYRNLAENPADQRHVAEAYPHASANVETRDESVFFARNVIDGSRLNTGHGDWPYQSWGIGARADATLTLEFGRPVRVDRVVLYLRADFPHDAYWTQASAVLSDGSEHTLSLIKTKEPQGFNIGVHTIRWLRLERLVKCDMPSAFPALSELQVFGTEA